MRFILIKGQAFRILPERVVRRPIFHIFEKSPHHRAGRRGHLEDHLLSIEEPAGLGYFLLRQPIAGYVKGISNPAWLHQDRFSDLVNRSLASIANRELHKHLDVHQQVLDVDVVADLLDMLRVLSNTKLASHAASRRSSGRPKSRRYSSMLSLTLTQSQCPAKDMASVGSGRAVRTAASLGSWRWG
eukprot:CAMPEP_0170578328 /NCGR_PEP_ID=MMETSP0224-20130122/5396_1 /TAXON_ID=285029 /ORGANISM="Togula jolla, Strain CCCM 725" /LENGTH=185 /DNA_ID=CAMNT_0010901287 /DNA_START=192 /DNA_END=751 /DNA_ORIENTATION=-